MLLGSLGRTVWLIIGMCGGEGRMILQVTIHSQDRWEWAQIDVKSSCIEDLRHQATVCHCYLVAYAIFAGTRRQQLLDCRETPGDPVLRPFLLALLANVNQHHQILQRLNATGNYLANLAYSSSFYRISRHQGAMRPRLLQVVQDIQLIRCIMYNIKTTLRDDSPLKKK